MPTAHNAIGLTVSVVLLGGYALAAAAAAVPVTAPRLSIADSVRAAISDNPAVQIQTARVRASLGALETARAEFSSQLSGSVGAGRDRSPLTGLQRAQFAGIDQSISDTSFYELALQRKFRSGLRLSSGISVTRSLLSAAGPQASSLPQLSADNIARVSLEAIQPLWKGAGVTANSANETGAARVHEAALLQLLHVGSERGLLAAIAYWNHAAAARSSEIASESVKRSQRLLEQTQILVKADKRAAADLSQLRADLADNQAQQVLAEQRLYQSRQELVRAMGLPVEVSAALPPLQDLLPEAASAAFARDLRAQVFCALAARQRYDLKAARQLSIAAEAFMRAAEANSQHRLDARASLGYTGVDSGSTIGHYFTALSENIGGANYGVGLQYEYQFGNNAANGQLLARRAQYEEARLAEQNLARNIQADVDIAVHELSASYSSLERAEVALQHHRRALDSEQKRFEQGFSTLFNLIQFQDRLDLAQNQHVNNQLRFAVVLISLRHDTGSFLRAGADDLAPQPDDYFRLPDLSAVNEQRE